MFTPGRIGSADRLAAKVAANPQIYRDAVERCLPWVGKTNAELRSTYLGLKGLLPDRQLPQIAVVIGANNSGGTAAPGIQVIGLEVICRLSPTEAAFGDRMRQFFAHETVHTFQSATRESIANGLLVAALQEGVPDYITELVTGRVPNATNGPGHEKHGSGSNSRRMRQSSAPGRTPKASGMQRPSCIPALVWKRRRTACGLAR